MSAPHSKYSVSHLSDGQLMQGLAESVFRERASLVVVLAHIAEVDDRQLFRPAGYSSMHAYCIEKLHLSEGATAKRVTAARLAREFPILSDAVADGRLHLSGISVMSKHLTPENVHELIAAATHKTRAQIEILIAERFPQKDVATLIRAIPTQAKGMAASEQSPGTVPVTMAEQSAQATETSIPTVVPPPPPRPVVKPLSPQRFSLQLTMHQAMRDRLEYLQQLMSHAVPSGDVVEVIDRAWILAIQQLEKRKFGKTEKPRRAKRRSNSNSRYIPAHVMRAVHTRDGSQCTFVSESGHRCTERRFLEYDHVELFAHGGEATVENLRLRCRAHNQFAAEQSFGSGFMHEKREIDRLARNTASSQAGKVLRSIP